MNQSSSSQGYPPYPPSYPNNNLPPNYYNPGPPLIVAQPNQINNAVDKIIEKQRVMDLEREKERLKDKIIKDQFKEIKSEIKHAKELNQEISRTQTNMLIAQQTKPQVLVQVTAPTQPTVIATGRFKLTGGMYCLFICINIVLPGIGTMIAACLYGSDTDRGNRTGEVICHGVAQFLLSWTIFGWIWAILEAVKYFEYGVCC
jgi:hypothetical protein